MWGVYTGSSLAAEFMENPAPIILLLFPRYRVLVKTGVVLAAKPREQKLGGGQYVCINGCLSRASNVLQTHITPNHSR